MPLHWQPLGPLPATTYWRRRGVLALVIVALAVLLWSCSGGQASSPTPKPTSSPTSTASPSPKPTPTATPTPAPTRSPIAVAVVTTCADEVLQVTLTGADTAAVGTAPRVRLVVRNTGAVACRRDLGPRAVELVVTSGADRVWSSADCSPGGSQGTITLPPGQADGQALTWPGTRSEPACAGSRAAAQAGTYRLVAKVGALSSPAFVLRVRG